MDKKKSRSFLQYAFWTVVALALVGLCLRSIDWQQFGRALKLCRWTYVLLSMALGIVVFYLRGIRYRMLLTPFDPSTSRLSCFNAYNIGNAVNLAIPRAGEFARVGYVVRHSALDGEGKRLLSYDKALGALLTERLWDALVTVGMAAALLAVMWDGFGGYFLDSLESLESSHLLWGALAALALLGGGGLYLAWHFRNKGGLWGKIWAFLEGIVRGLGSFTKMKNSWLFLLYTALIWTLYWLMSTCIVWALQDIEAFSQLTPRSAFVLMIAGSISAVVPVPGGFGAYHGAVCGALLGIWGIPIGTGMIYATLNHESQVLSQAICGLASYIHEHFFRK